MRYVLLLAVILGFNITQAEAPQGFRFDPNAPDITVTISQNLEEIKGLQKSNGLAKVDAKVIWIVRKAGVDYREIVTRHIQHLESELKLNLSGQTEQVEEAHDLDSVEAKLVMLINMKLEKAESKFVSDEIDSMIQEIRTALKLEYI